MKNFASLIISVFVSIQVFAQPPAGYYSTAAGLSGTPLRLALHNIIDGHTVVSYSSLWTHMQVTDKKANGNVWDMYSDVPGGTPPYEFTFVTDQCGNYSVEGDCYNREHSWPQSWFNSVAGPTSDLFHLYPTDGKVNGWRSNYAYGEVSNPSVTTQNGGKLGPNTFPGFSGTAFEPIDEYKGDFARSYFYMSTRYYTEDGGWSTSDMTNKCELLPWAVNLLMSWHNQDTVSTKEIDRNNDVYGIQNNRNPYIDHPEYVAMVWGNATGIATNTSSTYIHVYPNPANSNVTISGNVEQGNVNVYVFDYSGKLLMNEQYYSNNTGFNTILNVEALSQGAYHVQIVSGKSVHNSRIVISR